MIEENGFGDDADGVVGDDDGAGDEIAGAFGADGDAIGAHGIQICFDPLTGSASGFWPAEEEAEQTKMFGEVFMKEERLSSVLPAGPKM